MDAEKVHALLEHIGYSPETYKLVSYTDHICLIVVQSGAAIIDLNDGAELAHYISVSAAERSFTDRTTSPSNTRP